MSVKEGCKSFSFWIYMVVEILLIGAALACTFNGEFLEAIVIFILIEIREINDQLALASYAEVRLHGLKVLEDALRLRH